MNVAVDAAQSVEGASTSLSLGDWLAIAGLVLAVLPLCTVLVDIVIRIKRSSPRIALHQFILLVRRPWHLVLLGIIALSSAYLLVWPPQSFPARLSLLLPLVACTALLLSFFLAQSRELSGAVIVKEMRALSKVAAEQHNGICAAVRFDIDRLKAISNFSPALGERVRETVEIVVAEEVADLRRQGAEVVSIAIPGEDEIVVMGAGVSLERAAIFADRVRTRVRDRLQDIPQYAEAVSAVANRVRTPPSAEEEREGIGTVSAGVAANRGMAEIWFSDISAAVKESKVRGRNKTVVYRPGQEPEIHSDFESTADD